MPDPAPTRTIAVLLNAIRTLEAIGRHQAVRAFFAHFPDEAEAYQSLVVAVEGFGRCEAPTPENEANEFGVAVRLQARAITLRARLSLFAVQRGLTQTRDPVPFQQAQD